MNLLARLLAVALSLPAPWYGPGKEPESAVERAARIDVIVSAAVAEASAADDAWPGTTEDLAAALLSVTWFESRRWALEVHDGRARGDRGASVCLAQVWSPDRSLAGTSPDATLRCMHRAAEILVLHARRCTIRHVDEHQMARLLAAYGTGKTCHATNWSWNRARLWVKLRSAADAESTPSTGPVAVD